MKKMDAGVNLLTKKRVYEIAKELNTTSKRLMEKLAEIKIEVKNHMSLLEENQIEALYDHIGVIRHNEDKSDIDDKKTTSAPPVIQQKVEKKKEAKKAPRIIRTTEIYLDSEEEKKENEFGGQKNAKKEGKRRRNDFVKVATSTSGLRPGFVRDTSDYKKLIKKDKKELAAKENSKAADKDKVVEKEKTETTAEKRDVITPIEKGADLKSKANSQTGENKKTKNENKTEVKKDTSVKNDALNKSVKTDALNEQAKPDTMNMPVDAQTKKDEKSKNINNVQVNLPSANKNDGKVTSDNKKKDLEAKDNKKDSLKSDLKKSEKKDSNYKNKDNRNDYNRPKGDNKSGFREKTSDKGRDMNRATNKRLEIPKAELTPSQKEELNSQRTERRDVNKDAEKDSKRELKKEVAKPGLHASKNKNSKVLKNVLTSKKRVSEVLSNDFELDELFVDGAKSKRKRKKTKKEEKKVEKHIPPKAVLTSIKIPEVLTVKELAESLKKTSAEVIKRLMSLGIMATLNQEIDYDTAAIVADEFGVEAEKEIVINEEDILFDDNDDANDPEAVPRPPVVVVMGHVDHGKTSLLDAIKQTNVIESEAGGITQHIGAYMVKINNRNITFLDTPGHEAFTAMRARGAQVTDIAILVVAADDGVMPQTIEAINHAKAANVAIIVAINKTDKPAANPDRVKQELTEYGLVPEEWGGDTICVEVSAKQRINIDGLLEMVLLVSDMTELKANPNKQAKGTVIEARLDKDRGPIATLLVQRGTLNTGDSIITGVTVGRIRAMTDDKGRRIKKAGPSTPVEILGLPEVPEAGQIFHAITDEKIAKHLVEKRKLKQREQTLNATARVSLEDLFNQIKEGKVKELNIIVKADVQGSVEAVKQSLEKLSNDEVRIRIIHGGVGSVTESDVTLAQVSNAIIIGFNVRPSSNVVDAAKEAGVDLRLYRIIYDAIEDIQSAMKGMLDPTYREVVLGHIEIRQTFKVSGIGTIGGGYVTDGKVIRNSDIRLVRDGIVIHEGKLASLKRFKDDVKEVAQGFECGLSIEKFNDIKVGDVVEAFTFEEVKN